MSGNELGLYLRARREAIDPAEAGLPDGGRRNKPGLRRSEVATLAGISAERVARLEQGRDHHPSAPVLAALGDALRLTPAERARLYQLAKAGLADHGKAGPAREVRPSRAGPVADARAGAGGAAQPPGRGAGAHDELRGGG
nr:hypothetical protein GCM10020092_086690 [Actinoplanes digitatis]